MTAHTSQPMDTQWTLKKDLWTSDRLQKQDSEKVNQLTFGCGIVLQPELNPHCANPEHKGFFLFCNCTFLRGGFLRKKISEKRLLDRRWNREEEEFYREHRWSPAHATSLEDSRKE